MQLQLFDVVFSYVRSDGDCLERAGAGKVPPSNCYTVCVSACVDTASSAGRRRVCQGQNGMAVLCSWLELA